MIVKKYLTALKSLIMLSILLAVSSCGGGGSSGNSVADTPEDTDTTSDQTDSESENPSTLNPDTENPDTDNSETDSDINTSDESPEPIDDSNDNTGLPDEGDNSASGAGAVSIWRLSEIPGDIEPQRYEVNSKRQFGGIGSLLIDTDSFTRVGVVFFGNLDGFKPIMNIGDTLPDALPNTVVEKFDSTKLGPDGSMAITARLTGARPGTALIVAEEDVLRVVARTGETLSPVNGLPFEVQQFTALALGQGKTVFSARPEGVDDYLIILDDGLNVRIIAAARDTLLGDAGRPRSQEIDCEIGARDSTLGTSLDYLFNFERATMLDDGSVIFQAFHNRECAWGESIVRYNNDTYNIVVADGQPVPGAIDAAFRRGAKLIATPPGGRLVIDVGVTREASNNNPGFGLLSGSKTIWEYSVSASPRLVVAQGESLQTPIAQYFLDGQVFNAPSINFTYGNDSQYVMRGEDLGDGDETALFVGRPRSELAYTEFESVGASSLEYRVGTLDFLPEPFTEDNFLTRLSAIRVFDDGRLLFLGRVQDASNADTNFESGLWIADTSNNLNQIIKPGSTYPTVNGSPLELRRVDTTVSYDNGILMENGNIGFISENTDSDGTDVFFQVE